jgi:hypothetical protein
LSPFLDRGAAAPRTASLVATIAQQVANRKAKRGIPRDLQVRAPVTIAAEP